MVLNKKKSRLGKNKVLNLQQEQYIMNRVLNRYALVTLCFACFTISSVRAQSEGVLTVKSSEKIKRVVQKKLAYNKAVEQVSGFRIQLFYGSEAGAKKIGEEYLTLFPEGQTKLKFDSPDWKVMVGNYKTQLEADRALIEVKEAFVTAIIVPDMVDIAPKEE